MPTEPEINTLCELSQAEFKVYLTERARGLVRILFEEVMQAELTALLHVQPYERNAKRRGQRNGSYGRDLTTSLGRLEEVQVPRDRAGQFQTRVFEHYQRRHDEVDQAIQTMFIKGLSTSGVGQAIGPLLNDTPSSSTVSRIFHSLEEECAAWRQRPLAAHYHYIYLDGTYFTIGYEDEYEKTPILAAMGVTLEGEREVLGFTSGDKESRAAWDAFLEELQQRGLETADLWITDGGPAGIGAVEAKFPGAVRQRCVVHKVENILAHVPKAKQEEVRNELNRIFYLAANRDKARQEVEAFVAKWKSIVPEAVQCLLKDLVVRQGKNLTAW